ncbi:hypothetical protein BBJ28_00004070, partial [Nothophytophthora sp. Chile5]
MLDAEGVGSSVRTPAVHGELLSLDDDPEATQLLAELTADLSAVHREPEVRSPLALELPALNTATPVLQPWPTPASLLQPTSVFPVASQKMVKKQRNYNPNKARDERKLELAYLREERKDLELKLQQLQTAKESRATTSNDGGALVSAEARRDQLVLGKRTEGREPFVWEQTCARQLERRLRAERENIRLKMVLESQIQIAKSMERLLNKRTTLRAMESSGSSKRTTRVHVSREGNAAADAAVFEELVAGVEASYRDVDAVFEANGLVRSQVPTRDAQMRDGVNGMFMEIFDNKIMPFDMHATGEAWWRRWNHFNPNRGGTRLESTDDSIVEHFGMEMSDAKTKTTAKFHVQQILRRYVEENRIVVVWQSHIEPQEFSNKRFAGIHFREKGYVVIKPRDIGATVGDDGAYTLVQTCYLITPDLSDQRLNDDAKTGALTEFVLSATVANISASNEMIEN